MGVWHALTEPYLVTSGRIQLYSEGETNRETRALVWLVDTSTNNSLSITQSGAARRGTLGLQRWRPQSRLGSVHHLGLDSAW